MCATYCSDCVRKARHVKKVLFYFSLLFGSIWKLYVLWCQADDAVQHVWKRAAEGRLGHPAPVGYQPLECPGGKETQTRQNLHMCGDGLRPVMTKL